MPIRTTPALKAVAKVMLANPSASFYGYDLIRDTGLASGSLYPILARMEGEGWVWGEWEDRVAKRPPRRFYRLTDAGLAGAAAAVEGSK